MRLWLAVLIGLAMPLFASAQALPEQSNDVGYPSPGVALNALRSKPGVIVTENDGWTIIEDKSEKTLWTIAKPGNPAYPSAVKRFIANKGGAMQLEMKVLCGASKQACDDMVRQFQALNDNIVKSVQGKGSK